MKNLTAKHLTATRVLSWLLLLAAMAPWTALALPTTVLGNGGELYRLEAGPYGDLFPDGDLFDADRDLVVLHIERTGAEGEVVVESLIVPETEKRSVDSALGLLLDKGNGRLNAIWQTERRQESVVSVARYEGGVWSPSEEIWRGSRNAVPQIGLTRDLFEVELIPGEPIEAQRQVLHLVWADAVGGERSVLYRPALFIQGAYLDWQEDFVLGSLEGDEEITSALEEVLWLTVSDDLDVAVVTFGSAVSGHLITKQIAAVPLTFVRLSDAIRQLILDTDPEDLGDAVIMGVEIIGMGWRMGLPPAVADYVAMQVTSKLLELGPDYGASEIGELADRIHHDTLEATSAVSGLTAGNVWASTDLLEISSEQLGGTIADGISPSTHLLDVRRVVERPFPEIGGAENGFFNSPDGGELLAAWRDAEDPSLLWHIEWQGTAWSEPRSLRVGGSTSLEEALRLFRERLR